jgi:pyridoxine kinase
LLTGIPYREIHEESYLATLLQGLQAFGCDAVVITGVSKTPGKVGFAGVEKGAFFSYETNVIGKAVHGTGDLFCAVLTGGLLAGKALPEAAKLAAAFVERVLLETCGPEKEGIAFEPQLPWLWQQL